jgi:hypothetical protein
VSEDKTIVEIIVLAIIIGIVILAVAGVCSVNNTAIPDSPLHALNPLCKNFGWIIPNHS